MDSVLDGLLQCVHDLVPYDSASVILTETRERLFVAREFPRPVGNWSLVTLDTSANPWLQRVVMMKKSVHIRDTHEGPDWRKTKPFGNARCWMGIPLQVTGKVHGLLSICHAKAGSFTTEHFRIAKLLAIPTAIAIHNARLYEWVIIYEEERETLLKKARLVQEATLKD